MRLSQYIDGYLAANRKRGVGKGLTPGTYIAYQIRGSARQYSGRYISALINSCSNVGAVAGRSAGGGTAYYPADYIREVREAALPRIGADERPTVMTLSA